MSLPKRHEKHSYSGVSVTSMRSPRATTPPPRVVCVTVCPSKSSPRPSNLLDRHHCLLLYLLPIPCLCPHSNRSQRRHDLLSVDNARFHTVPLLSIFYCPTFSASLSLMFISFVIGPHACARSSCLPLRVLFPFIPLCLPFMSNVGLPPRSVRTLHCLSMSSAFRFSILHRPVMYIIASVLVSEVQ